MLLRLIKVDVVQTTGPFRLQICSHDGGSPAACWFIAISFTKSFVHRTVSLQFFPIHFGNDVLVKGSTLDVCRRLPKSNRCLSQNPQKHVQSPSALTKIHEGACKGWTDISPDSLSHLGVYYDYPAMRYTVGE